MILLSWSIFVFFVMYDVSFPNVMYLHFYELTTFSVISKTLSSNLPPTNYNLAPSPLHWTVWTMVLNRATVQQPISETWRANGSMHAHMILHINLANKNDHELGKTVPLYDGTTVHGNLFPLLNHVKKEQHLLDSNIHSVSILCSTTYPCQSVVQIRLASSTFRETLNTYT